MRISRSIHQDGTIAPSAVNYLQQIPDGYYFVNTHARRAPIAIYNVSFGQLTADFSQVLDNYFNTKEYIHKNLPQQSTEAQTRYGQLLKAQGNLVLSIQAHIDDCYAVLASLVDAASAPSVNERVHLSMVKENRVSYRGSIQTRYLSL